LAKAFCGPDLKRASKAAVNVIRTEGDEVDIIERWRSETGDVRTDPRIGKAIREFIGSQGIVLGRDDRSNHWLPAYGVGYEGEWCPVCDFWRNRDRWTA
jgi:hypothetical protein